MTQPQEQGASAARTAAGITLTFDPSKLFDVVAEVGDGGSALGCRIVGIMLTGGQSSFREDVGLAFYGVSAAPATLATPAPATPPGVPDSVREAAVAYLAARDAEPEKDCWDTETGEEEPGASKFASDWAWSDYHDKANAALQALRDAISAHPAGQSTGLGAVLECTGCGSRESIESIRARGFMSCCPERKMQPAPDSTRTGPVGTEEGARALWAAYTSARYGEPDPSNKWDTRLPEGQREYWREVYRASLAARPAAPEAQGAWRERAATEIDTIAQQWSTEGDADGRAYAKTLAAILRAEIPAPPSSGQEG